MSSWVDKENAAVYPSVGDEPVPHGRQLLAKVGRVLIFDLYPDAQSAPCSTVYPEDKNPVEQTSDLRI